MITIYGTVTELEWTVPPTPDLPPEPVLEDPVAARALRDMTDLMPSYYKARVVATPLEGEVPVEPPKDWVHIHIRLDEPHAGELQVNAPESQVGGLLAMGGRARVTFASN